MRRIALKPIQVFHPPQWLRGLFLLCVALCGAAPTLAGGASCSKPKKLGLSELETKLNRYKTLRALDARFEQEKKIKDVGVSLKSSGTFRMKAEKGKARVDWTVEKPAFLQLQITESSLELSEKPGQAGKPLVDNKDLQARILRPIYAWLTVDSQRIFEQFEVEQCARDFRMTPKEKEGPIESMLLQLDAKGLVERVVLAEKSGDELKIRFLDSKADSPK